MIRQTMKAFVINFETVQYNATLAITGSVQGTSKVKLYKRLGLESPKSRNGSDIYVVFIKSKLLNFYPIFLI